MRALAALVVTAALVTATPTELTDVPPELRTQNWNRPGSCAYASLVTALRFHGETELADWVRANRSGGATIIDIMELLDEMEVPYVFTRDYRGDVNWLERAVANRWPVILFHVPNHHCVNLVDIDEHNWTILDNNSPWMHIQIPAARARRMWQFWGSNERVARNSSGWAIALRLNPPPPWPDLTWDEK